MTIFNHPIYHKIGLQMTFILIFTGFTLTVVFSQNLRQPDQLKPHSLAGVPQQLLVLKAEVTENLIGNILPFWTHKMVDTLNGGFYGRMDGEGRIHADAEKGGVLNARILWTFSSAFRILNDSSYLKMATRARNYILAHFIDKEYGGAYLGLNSKGGALDTRKQVYNQAFFIYALSEYYLATGDKESLSAAKNIYSIIEKYSFDNLYNGYFEVFNRKWEKITDKIIGEKTDDDKKGMNTHLHLMEAYANLYKAWPDKKLEKSLRNLVDLFYNTIVDQQTFHLVYFSNEKWECTSPIESYGHDIEASWLLVEAAHILKDPELTARIEKLCIKMVNAACEGLQPDGSMIYERDKLRGERNMDHEWWTQAETVVGFVNAYQLTGDGTYLDKAVNSWNYIDKHFVDHFNGEWFISISRNGEKGNGDKAGYWKCPYHNSRMCLEIVQRASE